MKYRFFIPFLIVFLITLLFPQEVLAQKVNSNCVKTKVGDPATDQGAPPECRSGGGGIGDANGFTFPLKTTKSVILAGSTYGSTMIWCYRNESNCHHDYNAADIFAVTGTTIVAAYPGIVAITATNTEVGDVVQILGDDDHTYTYVHMQGLRVATGQTIKAGDELAEVGDAADAQYTPPHLHFDRLPPGYKGFRPLCSSAVCATYPFMNVQPILMPAYQNLPN